MQEKTQVTVNTSITAEETKVLIERLSDPAFVITKNQATVKDLAETLDMDPAKVILGLQQLRQEKVPLQPQWLGIYGTREMNLQDRKLAVFLISFALAISMIAFFMLFQRQATSPPPQPIHVITMDQTSDRAAPPTDTHQTP